MSLTAERQRLIAARRALLPEQVQQLSALIHNALLQSNLLQHAQHIGCYWPMAGEVDTRALITELLSQGKTMYLPRCQKNASLRFYRYTCGDSLLTGAYQTQEPDCAQPERDCDLLDCVIVPMVAFDQHRNRLGWGKGHFDRSFAFKKQHHNTQPTLIGLAYAMQELPRIEAAAWDVAMDHVVTEHSILSS